MEKKINPDFPSLALRILYFLFSVSVVLLIDLFFISGARMYWQLWAFLGIVALETVLFIPLMRKSKGLLKERASPGPGVKGWDVLFYLAYLPLTTLVFALSIADRSFFLWTAEPVLAAYILSLTAFILSQALFGWTVSENPFFSSAVRIQKDRNQKVVSKGPYSIVRHPGYLSGILMFLSIPVLLGSWIGILPALGASVLFPPRICLEESALKAELSGYSAYCKRVRYRLVPGIW